MVDSCVRNIAPTRAVANHAIFHNDFNIFTFFFAFCVLHPCDDQMLVLHPTWAEFFFFFPFASFVGTNEIYQQRRFFSLNGKTCKNKLHINETFEWFFRGARKTQNRWPQNEWHELHLVELLPPRHSTAAAATTTVAVVVKQSGHESWNKAHRKRRRGRERGSERKSEADKMWHVLTTRISMCLCTLFEAC